MSALEVEVRFHPRPTFSHDDAGVYDVRCEDCERDLFVTQDESEEERITANEIAQAHEEATASEAHS